MAHSKLLVEEKGAGEEEEIVWSGVDNYAMILQIVLPQHSIIMITIIVVVVVSLPLHSEMRSSRWLRRGPLFSQTLQT